MGDFVVKLTEAETGNQVGSYKAEMGSTSIRNSEPGDFTCEIPQSAPNLTREQFGPYRTDYHLYRTGSGGNTKLLTEGMLTSVNLSSDRDTVLLAGKDWLEYLNRRVYPFDPVKYIAGGWDQWPVGWPHETGSHREKLGNPVEVRDIVEDILERMQQVTLPALPGGVPADTSPRGQLGIIFNNKPTGQLTKYKIYPGDSTSVMDHITKLSEQVNGFEFDILPGSREFKMWSPGRLDALPVYRIKSQADEDRGQITALDWTNDGPEGTFLVGTGSAEHKAGAVWYYRPSVDTFRWLDKVYDFGEMANTDLLLQLLKDQNDLYPQRKVSLTLLNPEYLSPSFYLGDRPRGLIGRRITVQHNFNPYWQVWSDHKVNAINWSWDQSGNESVELELEIIYEEGGFDTLPHGI